MQEGNQGRQTVLRPVLAGLSMLGLVACSDFEYEASLLGTPAIAQAGRAVAVGGALAAVSVGSGTDAEPFAVDLFKRKPKGAWVFIQRLTAAPGSVGAFGNALALAGNSLAVGAPAHDDDVTPELESGYVDIFEPVGAAWSRVQTVVPTSFTPPLGSGTPGEFFFGASVDLDQGHLAVGAQRFHGGRGRAFVFDRRAGYAQVAELKEDVERFDANFGDTVRLSQGSLLVTRPDTGATTPPPKNGKVYMYSSADGFASPEVLVSHAGGTTFDGFGTAAALFADRLVVRDGSGVQLFEQAAGSWVFRWQLATEPGPRNSVALDDERVIIGEPNASVDGLSQAGRVMLVSDAGGSPDPDGALSEPVPIAEQRFGSALALSGKTLLIKSGNPFSGVGAAHIFRRP